jgi:thiamine-phosphate pyrophosphorylase
VLILPSIAGAAEIPQQFEAAIAGGDVASVIVRQDGMDEAAFQALAGRIVPVAQQAGIAAIIAGDTRVAGRTGADGIHVEGSRELREAVEKFQHKLMVGAGGAKTRDEALALGEERPDYILFGRFGYDVVPEPHRRNLALGTWWAEMIEIPCIVMAGSEVASVATVAATGAEFVGLCQAVFGPGLDPRSQVKAANEMLDQVAPRFED